MQAEVGRQLTKDLRRDVTELERDLLARAQEVPEFADALKTEYDAARAAERTGVGITEWRAGRGTQAAAAWVLARVFPRDCEDNGLLAGVPGRAGGAAAAGGGAEAQFFRDTPAARPRLAAPGDRALGGAHPAAAGLFDRRHNPPYQLPPSLRGGHPLDRVLAPPRRQGDPGVQLRRVGHPLPGRPLSRPLESARKTYALLQTPEFVEEFILDLTLTSAIEELAWGLRMIDPACGSGHFLSGCSGGSSPGGGVGSRTRTTGS